MEEDESNYNSWHLEHSPPIPIHLGWVRATPRRLFQSLLWLNQPQSHTSAQGLSGACLSEPDCDFPRRKVFFPLFDDVVLVIAILIDVTCVGLLYIAYKLAWYRWPNHWRDAQNEGLKTKLYCLLMTRAKRPKQKAFLYRLVVWYGQVMCLSRVSSYVFLPSVGVLYDLQPVSQSYLGQTCVASLGFDFSN